ncbi:MAG: type II toxin-antitoxin system PemK/MazF family toxin [Ilumatobacteraceae bacterium]
MRIGDVVEVDLGQPTGSEAGFVRPSVLVVADAFLRYRPSVVFVVPLTSTRRDFPSHIAIAADRDNGLTTASWAQVEQLRSVSTRRCRTPLGNVGAIVVAQILDVIAMITGIS